MQHVILGAGPAGVIAAEALRERAPNDRIVVIGDEAERPYSRMAIPYLLIGDIDEPGTHLRKQEHHFEKLNVEVRRARAVRVDTKARRIELDGGGALPYDRLLIATGASPVRPPIPGIDDRGVLACWTLEDARRIQQGARAGARVLQMGAGFIGCIIMEALFARRTLLTIVEMGDRMVPRMMGATAGGMIREWCEKKGVAVHTGARVESIRRDGDELHARLSTGVEVVADLVISATGVKPNISFLEGSGIDCATGVLTDDRMRTSVEDVYAAGDCAEALDLPSGRRIVSAIQPNAADQAQIAAANMTGADVRLRGVTLINVLDTLGLVSASFGLWEGVPGGEGVELTDREAFRHLSLQFSGDAMVGCNSVGWTNHIGVLRGLVEGRVPLGRWKDELLRHPTRLMEAYLATAQSLERRHH